MNEQNTVGWITAQEVGNLSLPQLVGFLHVRRQSKPPIYGMGFCGGRRTLQPEIQQSCRAERGRLAQWLSDWSHSSGRKKTWVSLTLTPFGLFVPFLSDDSVVKCTIAKIGAQCTLHILWAPASGKSCSSSWCSHCCKKCSGYNWSQAGKWYLSCWTFVEGFCCVKQACLSVFCYLSSSLFGI